MEKSTKIQVAAVDDDSDILNLMEQCLSPYKEIEFSKYDDSHVFWEQSNTKHFDIYIIDWKMPKINGMALLNRLRQQNIKSTLKPILVATGLLGRKDFRLLEEYPFVSLIEKPFQPAVLYSRIVSLHKQYLQYIENESKFKEVIASMDESKILNAVAVMADRGQDQLSFVLSAAKDCYDSYDIELAQKIYEKVIEKDPENLHALTALGKIALHQKDHSAALSYLEKAQNNSPHNLDRLCLLGQTSLISNEIGEAKNYFEEASNIDPSNEKVEAGKTLVANVEAAGKDGQNLDRISSNFVAMLNGIGVGFVKRGEYEAGVKHYQSALNYIFDPLTRARLSFNLGLAYLRWKKTKEALEWFMKSKEHSAIFSKADKYIDKILEATEWEDPRLAAKENTDPEDHIINEESLRVKNSDNESLNSDIDKDLDYELAMGMASMESEETNKKL